MERYIRKSLSGGRDTPKKTGENTKIPASAILATTPSATRDHNKENRHYPLSHITRPFSFKDYFSHTPSPSSTERVKFNDSRAKSNLIVGRKPYKLCPRPTR